MVAWVREELGEGVHVLAESFEDDNQYGREEDIEQQRG